MVVARRHMHSAYVMRLIRSHATAGRYPGGVTSQFPYLPASLADDRVMPEPPRRGLLRRGCAGKTLRGNMGPPRPENRFSARERLRA